MVLGFGIALSKSFNENTKIFGIELVEQAIKYANHNAKLNGLDPERVQFVSGDASNIFNNENFKNLEFLKNSVVIVDPSRKGSNESFYSNCWILNRKLLSTLVVMFFHRLGTWLHSKICSRIPMSNTKLKM